MNFDYTEEQRGLRDEAARFLEAAAPLSVARAVLDDANRDWDEPLWRRIAEQGWLGVAIPEAYGGLGLTHVELAAIAEPLGASLAPVPFGSTLYLFAESILDGGSETQRARWLPQVVSGEIVGCAALVEGSGELVPADLKAHVTNGRLTGRKTAVIDGGIATHAVIAAQGESGVGLYVADLGDAGVTRSRLESLDPTAGLAKLDFAGVSVEPLAGRGGEALDRLLARAAILYAFEQLGGADRCLTDVSAYVQQRQAFGGPIGRFQAVKHKLADSYVANQLARSHAYRGLWALAGNDAALAEAGAAARVAASDAYWRAAREGLHLHGAIGYTWDHDAHLFYRRALRLGLQLGSADAWRDRLFDAIAA